MNGKECRGLDIFWSGEISSESGTVTFSVRDLPELGTVTFSACDLPEIGDGDVFCL